MVSSDYSLLGCSVTDGMECMSGSAIYLMTTGISKSHVRIVLSSEVVTNLRFSSTKVMVLTGPRCWSYSWVISPVFISYYRVALMEATDMGLKSTCLDDLLVGHARQEDILFIFIRMELDTMRNLAVGESFQTLTWKIVNTRRHDLRVYGSLTSFGIPKLHLAIITTT